MSDSPAPERKRRGPVMVELETPKPRKSAAAPKVEEKAETAFDPSSAPAVPEIEDLRPEGRAMTAVVTQVAARRPSWLARIFWAGLIGLLGLMASVATWDFVANLMARSPVLGQVALGFVVILCIGLVALCLRELAAMSRLSRMDDLREKSEAALRDENTDVARETARRMLRLYSARGELDLGRAALEQRLDETLDASALLFQTERNLLEPLTVPRSSNLLPNTHS